MVNTYIPERGDLVWLSFNPQTGHEQKGNRPALVISPKKYNKKTNLAIFCPITSKIKNYPFEVIIESKKIKGAVLSDQIKNLDWKSRQAQFIDKIDNDLLKNVLEKVKLLIS